MVRLMVWLVVFYGVFDAFLVVFYGLFDGLASGILWCV